MNLIKPLVPQPVANPAGIKALCMWPFQHSDNEGSVSLATKLHNKFLVGPLLATPKQSNRDILTIPLNCMHQLLAMFHSPRSLT